MISEPKAIIVTKRTTSLLKCLQEEKSHFRESTDTKNTLKNRKKVGP